MEILKELGGSPSERTVHSAAWHLSGDFWELVEDWAGPELEQLLGGGGDARSIADALVRLHGRTSGARSVQARSDPWNIIVDVEGCPDISTCTAGSGGSYCPADVLAAAVIHRSMGTPVRMAARRESSRCIHVFRPAWFHDLISDLGELGGEAILMVRRHRVLVAHAPSDEAARALSEGLLAHEELDDDMPLKATHRCGNRRMMLMRFGHTFVTVCLRPQGADEERIRERVVRAVSRGG